MKHSSTLFFLTDEQRAAPKIILNDQELRRMLAKCAKSLHLGVAKCSQTDREQDAHREAWLLKHPRFEFHFTPPDDHNDTPRPNKALLG